MKISKKFKVAGVIVGIIIVSLIVLSEICMRINGYYYYDKLFNFVWNIFYETELKINRLQINVPKFDWLSNKKSDNNQLSFMGIGIYVDDEHSRDLLNKQKFIYQTTFYLKSIELKGFIPIIIVKNFNNNLINEWTKTCDVSLVKSIQKISNSELEAYDCISKNFKNIPSRYVIYKNIYFDIELYVDIFQSQYDKFFENVRLKE
ncbi:MAG: hypothetical protein LBT96_03190 [Campylobacteraceae bacterium]|jgi:hypothetical protein|nr:hypothetical protein [Campylobacteraceae bacterium]